MAERNPPHLLPALRRGMQEVIVIDELFLNLLVCDDLLARLRVHSELRLIDHLDHTTARKRHVLHALAVGAVMLGAVGSRCKKPFHHFGNRLAELIGLLRMALANVWLGGTRVEAGL